MWMRSDEVTTTIQTVQDGISFVSTFRRLSTQTKNVTLYILMNENHVANEHFKNQFLYFYE